MGDSRPVATILVPTHDHAGVLDLSVGSALGQTEADIEVIVVGDGVGDDTRDVMAGLCRLDRRVRFLDLPKGPNHGEIHRGRAVEEAAAEVVCYLSDDDLLLPEHVADMVSLLADVDLASCMNGHVEVTGAWHPHIGDLSEPACRAWLLQPDRNFVSLTGAAHTRLAYSRLPFGWRTTPRERWPDHYMWQQFLGEPWVRAASGPRVTALQFPSHLGDRESWTTGRRRAEMETWIQRLSNPVGRADFDHMTRIAVMKVAGPLAVVREAIDERKAELECAALKLGDELVTERSARAVAQEAAEQAEHRAEALECSVRWLDHELGEEQSARSQAEEKNQSAEAELRAVRSTRTWRLRSRLLHIHPLAALGRLTARHPRSD